MGPEIILLVVLASLIGAGIGTFTGLVPGIHVNTLASLMLVLYPIMMSSLSPIVDPVHIPIIVSSCIISASVVHSFVDFVPSVFIGAPDPDEVLTTLPGHRLLMEGKGMIAVRAAAAGSAVGASSAILLAIPIQYLMLNGLAENLDTLTSAILLFTVLIMILMEKNNERRIWATVLVLLSGILGLICMDLPIPANGLFGEGTLLFPMLTGLFGMPALLSSFRNASIPEQIDDPSFKVGPAPGIKGVITGAIAGWYPGITATAGASLSSFLMPEDRPERFISLVASIGTVTSIFSIVTLSVSGSGRSGTIMVVKDIVGDSVSGFCSPEFLLLLLCSAIASAVGYKLTISSGMFMSRMVNRFDSMRMNKFILCFIAFLVLLLTGPFGLVILAISTMIGMIPLKADMDRIPLTGCLIIPVFLRELNLANIILSIL